MDALGRRRIVRYATLLAFAGSGLAVALGLGLPDPGAAERAFAGFVGVLGCSLAWSWLRAMAAGRSPQGRFSLVVAGPEEPPPLAPAVAATKSLERGLGLGTTSIGSYNLFVRPRLEALASASSLGRDAGWLTPVRRGELLGDDWELVNPAAPPPEDRMAPGVSFPRIGQLVSRLEQLR